ncbi:transglutaminase-like domain-containing protein [Tenacibaculum sp. MEBiC06402]|uniref:transglutaminase-like domain-containing protein n=1 Tax=unclassified Tenacibaculum TaxID=2635139 RepID=UPI003B998E40
MNYLRETYFFDYSNEVIQNIISGFKNETLSGKEKTIRIYNKIRDEWRYDPYTISLSKEKYKASFIGQNESGNCVEKSVLLISCLRGLGIPARLHLGKVKNHIAVERLTEKFGSNELTPHGMVNVQLNGKWLKMSPAFNADLCKMFNVEPLAFDGENSSFLQQYNSSGSLFMEYVDDYGHFDDVPVEFMVNNIKEHYPHIFDVDNITEFKL